MKLLAESFGIFLPLMYFGIAYSFFRGEVSQQEKGYGYSLSSAV